MSISGKITLTGLEELKRAGRKFSVLTCYDAPTARIMEAAGVEVLLVGDTSAEVVLGLPSTRDISPDFLLELTAAVRRGAPQAFVMADLPYACRREGNLDITVDWVKRFFDQARSDAVKIEVSSSDAAIIERSRNAGVPVVAHLGLLPQYVDARDGYRAQGRDADSARVLIADAKRFENAGASMLLLEAVASEVAREIAVHTALPVVGCVCGPHCDGTVVVLHDMIGLGGGHPPRGVKRYEELAGVLERAFARYVEDIHNGQFPTESDAPHMKAGEFDKLLARTGDA